MTAVRQQALKRKRTMRPAAAAMPLFVILAGCGGSYSDQFGSSILISPAKYAYHGCLHLQDADNTARMRQKQLQELMTRAAKGPGGNVVGQIAYRSDYEVARAEREMIAQEMTKKQCVLDSKRSSERSMF
jgi:hypothetical protein